MIGVLNKKLETEKAITFVKDTFSTELMKNLNLHRVSSPLMVLDGTGINDDLNGVERTVKFPVKQLNDQRAVVVNSLAKWKRLRLKEYEIPENEGILTDMRAIRPDEDYSPIHSIYVDQWDWEKHISPSNRKVEFLKSEVRQIYAALRKTEQILSEKYDEITPFLPKDITFIHSEDLLKQYPHLSCKDRENEITQQYGAVFIIGIGCKLSDGKEHDGRAPDYDDWSTINEENQIGLNGDLMVWNPVMDSALELSSMGIRVDKEALIKQLDIRENNDRKSLYFHQKVLNEDIPQSIGGGIGQSRVTMFLLRKKHIGEVQVGLWPQEEVDMAKHEGADLL